MNMHDNKDDAINMLQSDYGFSDKQIDNILKNDRPLGADTEYILAELLQKYSNYFNKVKEHIEIVPVPLSESRGILTGKYAAKDRITSSSVDLVGDESMQRVFDISDADNPYRFDLRRGALARVAGGGIHFADELFKNKPDLVQIYLGVIQDRLIEVDGYKWPLDSLIIATSNNNEYSEFLSDGRQAPIIDRCTVCHVGHNTDYKRQDLLTDYALGVEAKTTVRGEDLHIDPNLKYVYDLAVVLTRMPEDEELFPGREGRLQMAKLAAGETAGEKTTKALAEVVEKLSSNPNIQKRFGQSGLGQRDLSRAIQYQMQMPETIYGSCLFALDALKSLKKVINDYVPDPKERDRYVEDLKVAKGEFRKKIKEDMYNAYMDEPNAIKQDVLAYVNMIVGLESPDLSPNNVWTYKDSTGRHEITIDEKYIKAVEDRIGGVKSESDRENFRDSLRKVYGQKKSQGIQDYYFMDNKPLVEAVTEVKLESDINGMGSLIGALTDLTNKDNKELYNRLMHTMTDKLGYNETSARRTIEFYCSADTDEI